MRQGATQSSARICRSPPPQPHPGACGIYLHRTRRSGASAGTSWHRQEPWGDIFGDPVVATALLDRLLHHAVIIQIEGSSYRLRQHADLIPEHVRSKAFITPPPAVKRRDRSPGKTPTDHNHG
jgi:IstB-like ATP binding protein